MLYVQSINLAFHVYANVVHWHGRLTCLSYEVFILPSGQLCWFDEKEMDIRSVDKRWGLCHVTLALLLNSRENINKTDLKQNEKCSSECSGYHNRECIYLQLSQ